MGSLKAAGRRFADHMSALDKAHLRDDVDEIETLKKIDIIFVHENFSDELMENIKRDSHEIDKG